MKKKKKTGFSRAREKERVVREYRMRIQCGIFILRLCRVG